MSIVIDAGERVYVQADGSQPKTVLCASGATVYYGDQTVDASTNDGNVTVDNTVTLTTGKWFYSATGSRLEIDAPDPPVYTQTYSTAARTVANPTAAAPAALTAAEAAGAAPDKAEFDALLADVTAVRGEVVKLVADLAADKKVLTALIDDLQAKNILG